MVLEAKYAGATFSWKNGQIPHSVLYELQAFKTWDRFFWDTLYVRIAEA